MSILLTKDRNELIYEENCRILKYIKDSKLFIMT